MGNTSPQSALSRIQVTTLKRVAVACVLIAYSMYQNEKMCLDFQAHFVFFLGLLSFMPLRCGRPGEMPSGAWRGFVPCGSTI